MKTAGRHLYFAYGSNLDAGQMMRRCPSALALTLAWLPEHRLTFVGFSPMRRGAVATVVPAVGRKTFGVVWSLSADDLARLDGCEGVPFFYERNTMKVCELGGKRTYLVQVYESSDDEEGPPADRYFEIIRAAYEQHKFPAEALQRPAAPKPSITPLRFGPTPRRAREQLSFDDRGLARNDLLNVAAIRCRFGEVDAAALAERLSGTPARAWPVQLAIVLQLRPSELDPFFFQCQIDPSYLRKFLQQFGFSPEPLPPAEVGRGRSRKPSTREAPPPRQISPASDLLVPGTRRANADRGNRKRTS